MHIEIYFDILLFINIKVKVLIWYFALLLIGFLIFVKLRFSPWKTAFAAAKHVKPSHASPALSASVNYHRSAPPQNSPVLLYCYPKSGKRYLFSLNIIPQSKFGEAAQWTLPCSNAEQYDFWFIILFMSYKRNNAEIIWFQPKSNFFRKFKQKCSIFSQNSVKLFFKVKFQVKFK